MKESEVDAFVFMWFIRDDGNIDKQFLLQKIKSLDLASDVDAVMDDDKMVISNEECEINGFIKRGQLILIKLRKD